MNVDEKLKQEVWRKATLVSGQTAEFWRKDKCGAWIGWKFYGDRTSPYGWEIDHINPAGGDELNNLQPLQWKNNVLKSDGRLFRAVTSKGIKNVIINQPNT